MTLLKGNTEALAAYRKRKARALVRTAPARKRAAKAKAAYNAGTAPKPTTPAAPKPTTPAAE